MDTAVKPKGRADHDPASDDLSKEALHLEELGLRPHVWRQTCRIEEMTYPGNCVTRNISDESIISLRESKGRIRAFHQVGSHCGRRITGGWGTTAENVSASSRTNPLKAPAISRFHQVPLINLFNEKPAGMPRHD